MAEYDLQRIHGLESMLTPEQGWFIPVSKFGNVDKRLALNKLTKSTYFDEKNIGPWNMAASATHEVTLPDPSSIAYIDKVIIYDDNGIEYGDHYLYCDQFATSIREIAKIYMGNNTGSEQVGLGYLPQLVTFGAMTKNNWPSPPSYVRYAGAEFALSNNGHGDQYKISFTPVQLAAWGGTINADNCFGILQTNTTRTYFALNVLENEIHIKLEETTDPFKFYIFRQNSSSISSSAHVHTVGSIVAGMAYRVASVGYQYNHTTGVITLMHNARADSLSLVGSSPGTGVLSRYVSSSFRGKIIFKRNFV